jgi:hypothetical protein
MTSKPDANQSIFRKVESGFPFENSTNAKMLGGFCFHQREAAPAGGKCF